MPFSRLINEGRDATLFSIGPRVMRELTSTHIDNDIPSSWARTATACGRFAGLLCQHLFVNSQTAGVNPSASAEIGLDGLPPLITVRITVGSGLLA